MRGNRIAWNLLEFSTIIITTKNVHTKNFTSSARDLEFIVIMPLQWGAKRKFRTLT